MTVAYHETFWVVIGTAAPVLALANVVASSGVMDAAVAARGQEDPDKPPRRELIRLHRGMPAIEVAYLLAGNTFMLNSLLLVLALLSLAWGRDLIPPVVMVLLIATSLLLALMQAQTMMLARIQEKRRRELGDGA